MVVSLEGKVFVRTAEFTLMIALLQITGRGVKKNLNQITIGSDQPHYLLNDKKYKRRCDLLWSRFCQLSIASRDIIIYKECTNAISPYYSLLCLKGENNLVYFLFDSSDQEKLKFSYCQGLSVQRFIGETIGQRLDKTVDRFPDREAYVFCEDNQRATFADFQEEVRVASGQRWCRLIQDSFFLIPN